MIIGISAEMAIFYVSEFTELAQRMPAHDALRESSRNRLRRITMTALAAIFTLLPWRSRLVRAPAFNSLWHRRPLPDCSSNFRRCCWPCRFCSHSRYDRSGGHSAPGFRSQSRDVIVPIHLKTQVHGPRREPDLLA